MLPKSANYIIESAVIRVSNLNSYYLAQFVLEALRTALFHLLLAKCQFVLLPRHIVIIEAVPNRVREPMLQTFLPEIF